MRSNCQNFIKDWISSKDSRCPGPVLLCLASLEMCFVDEDEAVSWEECIIIINLWRHDSKARTVISIPLCPGCSMLHFITGHLDAEVGCQMVLPVSAHCLAPDPQHRVPSVRTVLRNCKTSIRRPLCWVSSNIDRKSNKLDTSALESSR